MSSSRRNIKSTVRLHGIREAAAEIQKAALAGLNDAADFVLVEADKQVPVESGHLVGTGLVTMQEEKFRAAISYDGPYAVYQHELLHLKHVHGGNAKFLERPLVDETAKELEIIADRIREVVGE